MQLKQYRFRPQLIPTLATAMLIPLFLHLGHWQAGKAELKAALQARYEQRMRAVPQALPRDIGDVESLRYLRVHLRGHYDATRSLLLDNQIDQGRAGFHVITPLQLEGEVGDKQRTVLINRGWVPFSGDRKQLPDILTPSGLVEIHGQIMPVVQQHLDPAYMPKAGDEIWATLDMAMLSRTVHGDLQPVVVRMEADSAGGGYVRDWEPPDERITMHRSYALQWKLIAGGLFMAWLVLSFHKSIPEPESGA